MGSRNSAKHELTCLHALLSPGDNALALLGDLLPGVIKGHLLSACSQHATSVGNALKTKCNVDICCQGCTYLGAGDML